MSIFDQIAAPIKATANSIFDTISKPIKAVEKLASSPDNSAIGVLKNTVLGLPKAAADVGGDILRAPGRAAAGVAASINNQEIKPETPVEKFVLGDQPIKSLQQQNQVTSDSLQKLGLSKKTAGILAPIGVVGSTALDLSQAIMPEDALLKDVAVSTSESAIKKLISENVKNITPEVLDKVTPELVKATDVATVKQLLTSAAEDSKTPIEKLTGAIREAKPATKEISAAQSLERGKRFGTAAAAQATTGGQQGYFEALSKLKGELVDKSAISFEPIQGKLKPEDVSNLFSTIQQHPTLNFGEQLSTQSGLQKLLQGQTPQPKQLQLLEEVFGSDVIKAVQEKRPLSQKVTDMILNVINLPRSLKTTLDMSAPFRQGIVMMAKHPLISGDAFGGMVKDAFSETSFNKYLDDLYKSPDYRAIKDSGLYVADPRKIAGGLTSREEQFMSNLVENIPIVGAPARASSRAYSSFLNRQRVGVFQSVADQFAKDGVATPENLKSLAGFVNTASGRGSLGELERNTKLLSSAFFSPKFNASRISLLNPAYYAKLPAPVRQEAIKSVGAFAGTVFTILGLAKASGAQVEADPRSSDFGKIKIGNTRYDITGGFQPWIRLFAQLATGERKSTTNGGIQDLANPKYGGSTRLDVVTNFVRSKLAPVPGIVSDLLAGKDVTGQPVTAASELKGNTTPLVFQDISDAIKDQGLTGLLSAGAPAFFGVGVQTYNNTKSNAAADILSKNQKGGLLGGSGGSKATIKLPKGNLPKLKLPKLTKLPPIK